MRFDTLTNKLIAGIVPVVLLFLFSVGVGSYLMARSKVLEGVDKDVKTLAVQAADSVQVFFRQRRSDMEAVSEVPLFFDYFKNADYGLHEESRVYLKEIDGFLRRFIDRSGAYSGVEFLNENGEVLAAAPARALQLRDPKKRLAELKAGRPIVSPILFGPRGPYQEYSAPLIEVTGRIRGAVVLQADLNPVVVTLARVRVGAGGGGAWLEDNSGQRILGVRSPGTADPLVGTAPVGGTGLRVVVHADPADYSSELYKVQAFTGALAALAGLCVTLLVTWRVRQATKPIEEMAEGTKRLAAGDLDYRFAPPPIRELQALGDSFNEMAQRLKERNGELRSRIRELTSLRQMDHAVAERVDEDTLLRTCLRAVAGGLAFDRVGLYWVDHARSEIIGRFVHGPAVSGLSEAAFRRRRVKRGEPDILNSVVETRESVLVKDPGRDPRLDPSFVTEANTTEFVMAPICGKDRVFGVLTADNISSRRPLADSDRESLTLFANAVGLALENSLLLSTLADSEARYRSVLENSPVAVLGLTAEQWIATWNRGAEELFGYSAAEIVGMPVTALLTSESDEDVKRLLTELMTHGFVREFPVAGRTRDGRKLELSLSWGGAHPDFWANKEWTVVIRDVTEARKLQKQVIQSEKLSAVGQLISGIAHELNNPLQAVLSYATMVARQTGQPELRSDLKVIFDHAVRCRKIIDNLLLFVRQGEVRKIPVSVKESVGAALELLSFKLREASGVKVEVKIPARLPRLKADPQQIQQVIVNLVGNACDSLADWAGDKRITITARKVEGVVRVEVHDSGPGVPVEARSRLFEPFFTTKQAGHGTGLGLATCRQIIGMHDGQMGLGVSPEGGALFWFELPAAKGRAPKSAAPKELPAIPGARVLLVDDEPAVRGAFARFLQAEGHSVVEAGTLKEAFRAGSEAFFDLVVADIRLSDGSGLELYDAWDARTRKPRPAFLYVTGDMMNTGLSAKVSERRSRLLNKPVGMEDFQRAVRELLTAEDA